MYWCVNTVDYKNYSQIFRHGLENLAIMRPRRGPAPWLLICAPNLLGAIDCPADIVTLSEDKAVILELNVMRHQPQPNWPQLMKVIINMARAFRSTGSFYILCR